MRVEMRADNTAIISGYVNVTGRESRVLSDISGDFIEEVTPGAFGQALERAKRIELRFNHGKLLGSTVDNLKLYEDNIGLYAEAVVNDKHVIAEARANKLTGWSFGFFVNKLHWETRQSDQMRKRVLEDIDLTEVSILSVTPAYIATSVELRADGNHIKESRGCEQNVEFRDYKKPEPQKPQTISELEYLKLKHEFLKGGN